MNTYVIGHMNHAAGGVHVMHAHACMSVGRGAAARQRVAAPSERSQGADASGADSGRGGDVRGGDVRWCDGMITPSQRSIPRDDATLSCSALLAM